MRLERLALVDPGLERVERAQARTDAERERRALRTGDGIGEDTEPAREPGDAIEQESRPAGKASGHFGDPPDLEAQIGAVDAPQRMKLVDELDEFAQILVHSYP